MLETVKAHLKQSGMTMKQVIIIDATLISAPSSTKNKSGEWDPEMRQTKEGQSVVLRNVAVGPRNGKCISV